MVFPMGPHKNLSQSMLQISFPIYTQTTLNAMSGGRMALVTCLLTAGQKGLRNASYLRRRHLKNCMMRTKADPEAALFAWVYRSTDKHTERRDSLPWTFTNYVLTVEDTSRI